MKILLIEATLLKFGRVKDGSVNFSFRSMREMNNEEFALVDRYYQKNGHMAFKLDEIEATDVPTENTSIKGQLSPSQILRRKIFALHMKKNGTKEDFPDYYGKVMAGFENAVQEELDNLED